MDCVEGAAAVEGGVSKMQMQPSVDQAANVASLECHTATNTRHGAGAVNSTRVDGHLPGLG